MPEVDRNTAYSARTRQTPSLETTNTDSMAINQQDLKLLEAAAKEAGALALRYFKRDPKIWTKGNDSPVTEADLAVDKMLHKSLLSARPDYGWLSEETEDNPDRLDKERLFVVDPIDGTRAFIAGGDEWTISLAVVEGSRPVAAALFAPVRDELYLACAGGGASLNGQKLVCPQVDTLKDARSSGPRPSIKKGPLAKAGVKWCCYIPSLAYRLVMVTNGDLDLALARPDSNDWDLAAADLIVEESGGILRDEDNLPIRYNQPVASHGALYAAHPDLAVRLAPLMKSLTFPQRR